MRDIRPYLLFKGRIHEVARARADEHVHPCLGSLNS